MADEDKKFEYIEGKGKVLKEEISQDGFFCVHCNQWIPLAESVGTKNRNHCPFCLWSKHVDLEESGDRNSNCEGMMEPIGLVFKNEGFDKFGNKKIGELMLVHECQKCGRVSINRIAGDDDAREIMNVFEKSLKLKEEEIEKLEKENIVLLKENDRRKIESQLFGITA